MADATSDELIAELHGSLIDLRRVLLSIPTDGRTDTPEIYLEQLRDAVRYTTERVNKVEQSGELHPKERREVRSVVENVAETYQLSDADELGGGNVPYLIPLSDCTDQQLLQLIWADWAPRGDQAEAELPVDSETVYIATASGSAVLATRSTPHPWQIANHSEPEVAAPDTKQPSATTGSSGTGTGADSTTAVAPDVWDPKADDDTEHFDKYRGAGPSYAYPSPKNVPPVADPVAAFLYECEQWLELTRWVAFKTHSMDRDAATDDAVLKTAAEISELQRKRFAVRNSLQSLEGETVAMVLEANEDPKPIFSLVRAAGSAASQFGEYWPQAHAVLKSTQARLRAAEQKDVVGVVGISAVGPVHQRGPRSGAVPVGNAEPTTEARQPEPGGASKNAQVETLYRLRDAVDELTERVSRFSQPLYDTTGADDVVAIGDRVKTLQEGAGLPRMVQLHSATNPDVVAFRVYDPELPERKGVMGGIATNSQSAPTTWPGNEINVPVVLEYLGRARRFVERAIREANSGRNGKAGGQSGASAGSAETSEQRMDDGTEPAEPTQADIETLEQETRPLDRDSGEWMKAASDEMQNVYRYKHTSLRDARKKGRKTQSSAFGIDSQNRYWRRDPDHGKTVWYLKATVKPNQRR